MELKIVFLLGSSFIFGVWVCTGDKSGILQHYLMQTPGDQPAPISRRDAIEELAGNLGELTISSPTRTLQDQPELNSGKTQLPESAPKQSDNCSRSKVQLPFGLKNIASAYQVVASRSKLLKETGAQILLKGAQQGLILKASPEGAVVRWANKGPRE